MHDIALLRHPENNPGLLEKREYVTQKDCNQLLRRLHCAALLRILSKMRFAEEKKMHGRTKIQVYYMVFRNTVVMHLFPSPVLTSLNGPAYTVEREVYFP